MKIKNILTSLLAMVMVLTSVQVATFAETDDHYYNLYGDFVLYNEDCLEMENNKQKKDVKMVITKNEDPSVTVSLPLKFDDEEFLEGFWGSDYLDTPEMKTILTDLEENQQGQNAKMKAKKNAKAALKNAGNKYGKKLRTKKSVLSMEEKLFEGYTVSVEGIEDHYKIVEPMGILTTAESFQAEIDETVKMIRDYGGSAYKNYETPDTYTQLMDDFVKAVDGYDSYVDMLKDDELTEKEIEEELEYLKEKDAIYADVKKGEFGGQLDVIGDLECDCPESAYVMITHEYYKVIDGKRTMILSNEEEIEVHTGDTVYGKDYAKTTLNDETYELTETLSYIERKPTEKLEINKDFLFGGLILCYDYVESEDEPAGAVSDDDEEKPDKPKRKPEVVTGEDGPNTGDYTPVGMYLMLLAAATVGCIGLCRYRKR